MTRYVRRGSPRLRWAWSSPKFFGLVRARRRSRSVGMRSETKSCLPRQPGLAAALRRRRPARRRRAAERAALGAPRAAVQHRWRRVRVGLFAEATPSQRAALAVARAWLRPRR